MRRRISDVATPRLSSLVRPSATINSLPCNAPRQRSSLVTAYGVRRTGLETRLLPPLCLSYFLPRSIPTGMARLSPSHIEAYTVPYLVARRGAGQPASCWERPRLVCAELVVRDELVAAQDYLVALGWFLGSDRPGWVVKEIEISLLGSGGERNRWGHVWSRTRLHWDARDSRG